MTKSTVLVLATCLLSNALHAAESLTDTRQSELRHLVRHDCGSCHGMKLTGGLGPSLTPDALANKNVAALSRIISTGVPGKAMPPWKSLLTKNEIDWIVHQLKAGNITK